MVFIFKKEIINSAHRTPAQDAALCSPLSHGELLHFVFAIVVLMAAGSLYPGLIRRLVLYHGGHAPHQYEGGVAVGGGRHEAPIPAHGAYGAGVYVDDLGCPLGGDILAVHLHHALLQRFNAVYTLVHGGGYHIPQEFVKVIHG